MCEKVRTSSRYLKERTMLIIDNLKIDYTKDRINPERKSGDAVPTLSERGRNLLSFLAMYLESRSFNICSIFHHPPNKTYIHFICICVVVESIWNG